jgi:WD40 repeat protein
VAFSHNLTKLASKSYDKTVKIWDMRRDVCLGMSSTRRLLYRLLFNPTSPCLYTDMGTIATSGLVNGDIIHITESQ